MSDKKNLESAETNCERQWRGVVEVTLEVDNNDVGIERIGVTRGGMGRGRGDLKEPWCCDDSGRGNMVQHAAQWWPGPAGIEVPVPCWDPSTADTDNLT